MQAEMEEERCITTMDMAVVVPPPELRRTILQVFTTKHSLQLHLSAIGFITLTLTQHGLLDQPLEWEEAIDVLAQGIVDGQLDIDPHSSRIVTRGSNQNVDTGPSECRHRTIRYSHSNSTREGLLQTCHSRLSSTYDSRHSHIDIFS